MSYQYKNVTELPPLLNTLKRLYCYMNSLPNSLTELYCSNERLSRLSLKLPKSLINLDCTNNRLTATFNLKKSNYG